MSNDPNLSEFDALCDAVFDNLATAEQVKRLEELVLASPELKRRYVELAHQNASLSWGAGEHQPLQSLFDAAVVSSPLSPADKQLPPRRRLNSWPIVAAALALGLVFALLSPLVWRRGGGVDHTVAQLHSSKNCAWRETLLPTTQGSRLLPGRMRLAEGVATIRFDHGVDVDVEGPADFEIIATDRIRLYSGRLVATAEEGAEGFAVLTPTAELVDKGTVFGVSVADTGVSDVVVFEGLVDAKPVRTGESQLLETGERLQIAAQKVESVENGSEAIIGQVQPRPHESEVIQISTAVGRGQDGYIQRVSAQDGHDSSSMVLVKNCIAEWPGWDRNPKDWDRKGYVRFDLSLVDHEDVHAVELSLFFAPTGFGFASRVPDATFAVYGMTDEELDNWIETELTWRNAPANAEGSAEVDAEKAILLGKFVVPQGQSNKMFSVRGTPLTDFVQSDTNDLLTLIVVRETPSAKVEGLVHGFASRRHPDLPPPTLRIIKASKP